MPFLILAYAIAIMPNALHAITTLSGIDLIWLILLGAMVLGICYWFFYMSEAEMMTKEFMRLDSDHDGYISREEASKWKYLAKGFDKFDTNHDGKISRQEYEKAVQK
jgi:hypothetical protein